MYRIYFGILLTFLIYLSGCDSGDPGIHISAEEFVNLAEQPNAVILDVRTDAEYNSGHLKDAVLINLHAPDFSERIRNLDKSKTYYVYCQSGGRSTSAVRKMRAEGIAEAYNIRGGIYQLARHGAQFVE